ncbi:hypothetical protein A2673_01295 [Candidatus Kaiserbacteria bacterium RIFCSPHIGHO2_01_FULL_50_13]|uniref:Uncharacterized protein n=1 Tax=Candidatus Kaiserbacteria bacterium RIFCSPLOWO2_01_FULL_50_24 TaxID=1798507 RepID=A0A1F6ENC6_9BACT|nr:MAG: hypothetical protein A2673_01295 [Candidatus Kaiserbacteria bacterium RIFCSPHIGHO2_01_FULL_50_13]OGG75134.1 MAG: hypothetical protein A3A34_02145 [Candidatus Kaiserbacteria bacterium RIFCSPLOWO2_01_FULL_50_24]OGG81088.1 MAG: hypothetical protein A3H74_04170 [Candidatus Kaiserbacteria bacterium RIFCSPLOWO2_02_FULL_51_13]
MTQEALKQEPAYAKHLHQVDGEWYMRLDKESRGVKIPADIARVIKGALRMEQLRKSDKNMRIRGAYSKINCHETALFAIGALDRDYALGNYSMPLFPDVQYKQHEEFSDLQTHVQKHVGNELWLVQVKAFPESKKVEHSFLAGIDERGNVVCFEKQGSRHEPLSFRVTNLVYIYGLYSEKYWAGGSIDSIKEHPLVKKIHERKGPPDIKSSQSPESQSAA